MEPGGSVRRPSACDHSAPSPSRPYGQLAFLLVVGNLTWGLGTLGAVAAAVTNGHAAYSWFTSREAQPGDARSDERAAEVERDAAETLSGRVQSTAVAATDDTAYNGWIADADGGR